MGKGRASRMRGAVQTRSRACTVRASQAARRPGAGSESGGTAELGAGTEAALDFLSVLQRASPLAAPSMRLPAAWKAAFSCGVALGASRLASSSSGKTLLMLIAPLSTGVV